MSINAEKGLAIGRMRILGYKIKDKRYVVDGEIAPIVKKFLRCMLQGTLWHKS